MRHQVNNSYLLLHLQLIGINTAKSIRRTKCGKRHISLILFSLEIERLTVFQNQQDALISQIYFLNRILHVSDNSSVHHQEFFFTVHTEMV